VSALAAPPRCQADAYLPVALANGWLRLHRAWLWLRNRLPPSPLLDPIWDSVFALHPPHTSLFGPWLAHVQRLLPALALTHIEVKPQPKPPGERRRLLPAADVVARI
jgi:hypothetical protein